MSLHLAEPKASRDRPQLQARFGRTQPMPAGPGWWVLLGVVAPLLAVIGSRQPSIGLLLIGLSICLVWKRGPASAPRAVVMVLAASFAATLLAPTVGLVVAVATTGLALWMVARTADGRSKALPALVALTMGWWVLLLLHPNVPDLSTGILGLRKSTFALVGLALGWAWPRRSRAAAELVVVTLLIASLISSLAIHRFAPGVEASVARAAETATSQFAGRQRLQGVFAGPFHVALAASFLCVWAFARWAQRRVLSGLALIVGLLALHQAGVRTGYLAVLLGCLVLIIVASSAKVRIKRLSGALILVIVATLALSSGVVDPGASLESLTSLTSDSRAQNRIPQMREAVDLIIRSPLVGWGPGSAGDAMGDRFSGDRVHVSAHNVVLKLGVEGGLVGLALIFLLVRRALRRIDWASDEGTGALCALTVMLSFGLSGSMIEALPVTFVLLVLVGTATR